MFSCKNSFLIQPRTSPPKICKILLIFPILRTLTPSQRVQAPDSSAGRWSSKVQYPTTPGATVFGRIIPAPRQRDPSVATFGRAAALRGVGQTLQGSFSAVSRRNFASKHAFESSRRDLHNAPLCTPLKSHIFQKIARILPKFCGIFQKFKNQSLLNFAKFCNFLEII